MVSRKLRVLVIDDDPAQQRLIKHRLESADTPISQEVVGTLEAFVEHLASGRWDAVVLDYHLAHETASDVLRQYADRLAGAAIIVMSASQTQEVVIETLRQGAIDFLPKHQVGQPGALVTSIQNAVAQCRRKRMERRKIERRCRQLHHQAETDTLTGLSNRAHLQRCVKESRWRNDRRRQVCAMIDIDHFKNVNDTHGHDVGDIALKEVAHILKHSVPEGSTVIRWGGEEFAVVIGERDECEAFAWAERFRKTVASHVIKAGNIELSVTVSVGLTHPRLIEDQQPPFKKADTLLYTAKHMGRNQVVTPRIHKLYKAVKKTRKEMHETTVRRKRDHLVAELRSVRRPLQHEHIGVHGDQVAAVVTSLCCRMELSAPEVKALRDAAVLHDVGRAILPENILSEPGRLKPAQWAMMNKHAQIGAWVARQLDADASAAWLVAHHHMRFDQSCDDVIDAVSLPTWTPEMLRRAAGILALADAVVTMRSNRSYAPAIPEPQVQDELRRLSGQQFFPEVVQTYVNTSTSQVRRLAA